MKSKCIILPTQKSDTAQEVVLNPYVFEDVREVQTYMKEEETEKGTGELTCLVCTRNVTFSNQMDVRVKKLRNDCCRLNLKVSCVYCTDF